MNLDLAKDRILVSTLSLGSYVYDNSITSRSDTINAFVFKQNPEYRENATIQLGSVMYLWLTVDSSRMLSDSAAVLPDTIPATDLIIRKP